MKTAISIRDEVFEAAERMARARGMSRSEWYTAALKEFVARHAQDGVTGRLDAVYGHERPIPALDETLATLQSMSLPHED